MALLVAGAVFVSGCSGHMQVRANTAPPPPPAHGSASVGVHLHSTSLAALIIAAALLGVAVEGFRHDAKAAAPARAPLAPERSVNEQDCSKPIADPYANLRCR